MTIEVVNLWVDPLSLSGLNKTESFTLPCLFQRSPPRRTNVILSVDGETTPKMDEVRRI
jgi:hypothetical protein